MNEVTGRSVFGALSKINVEKFVKGKNGFKYLSWSDAVNELLRVYPEANWSVTRWDNMPYLDTPSGCFVETTVTIEGISRTHLHPILDYRNKPVKQPDSFQVNTSIMRCLTKAISMHGMGLYIYQGEDLPPNLIDGLREEMKDLLGEPTAEQTAWIMRADTKALTAKVNEYKDKKEKEK